jgi:hypothetical protein
VCTTPRRENRRDSTLVNFSTVDHQGHRHGECVRVHDADRLRHDLGQRQHRDHERGREPRQRDAGEGVRELIRGDRGAAGVGDRVQHQDRGDRAVGLESEPAQDLAGATAALRQRFDPPLADAEQGRLRERTDERGQQREGDGEEEEQHVDVGPSTGTRRG